MLQFKYFGTTVTNQNLIQEEIKRRRNGEEKNLVPTGNRTPGRSVSSQSLSRRCVHYSRQDTVNSKEGLETNSKNQLGFEQLLTQIKTTSIVSLAGNIALIILFI
jgi:hypothetical protein